MLDRTYSTPFLGVSSESWLEERLATDMRGTGPSGPASERGAVEEMERVFDLEGPAALLLLAAAAATLGTDLRVKVWKERVKAMLAVGLAARPIAGGDRK